MKKNEKKSKILSDKDKIRLLDFNEIIQINEYKNILEFGEFKELYELRNRQLFKEQVKQLNKKFKEARDELLSQNEELLASLEEKQAVMISELNTTLTSFTKSLAEIINLDSTKRDYLLQGLHEQCEQLGIINQDSLTDQIKIRVSFNDHQLLTQGHNDNNSDKYLWLLKAVKIDYSLKDGIAILESKFSKYFISYERAQGVIKKLLEDVALETI